MKPLRLAPRVALLASIFASILACGGAVRPLDERACRQYDQCGVQGFDACMAEAAVVQNDALKECLAASSCEELRAGAPSCTSGGAVGGGFGDGSGCRSRGVQDCPFLQTCCAPGGGGQQVGFPGTCMDIAICNFPTR